MYSKNVRLETSCINNSRGELIRHLVIDDIIWMSNDDEEYEDIERALKTAHGKCYVGGLGMGLIVRQLLKKPEVTGITVVEINPYVVQLFGAKLGCHKIPASSEFPNQRESWMGSKIDIMIGDATKEFFGTYDWMYFDIWLEPDAEGQRLMELCEKNARSHLKPNGVIEGWFKPRLDNGQLAI